MFVIWNTVIRCNFRKFKGQKVLAHRVGSQNRSPSSPWLKKLEKFHENSSIFEPWRIFQKSRIESRELGLRFLAPMMSSFKWLIHFSQKMKIAGLIFLLLIITGKNLNRRKTYGGVPYVQEIRSKRQERVQTIRCKKGSSISTIVGIFIIFKKGLITRYIQQV